MTFSDRACLTQQTCAEGFEYFGYTSSEGIEAPIEGIVGLSQNKQMLLSEEEIAVGPLLVDALLADGAIDTPKFSFAMHGLQTDTQSYLDIGQPNSGRVKSGNFDEQVFLGMNDDFFWSASAQAIAFGETENGVKLEGAPYAVFDTGTPYIFAPPRYYDVILEEMVFQAGSPEVIVDEGVSFVDCQAAK